MKFNAIALAVLFLVSSGFTWGGSSEPKETTYPTTTTKPKTNYGTSSSYGSSSVSSETDPRVSAVRLLASGTEEERAARLESLQRIGAAMAKKNQN